MSYKVEHSPNYKRDVRNITDYISIDLKNIDAAQKLTYKLKNTIETLSIFPRSGAVLERLNPFETKYRFVPIGNYLLFYHIVEERQTIHIDRVIYARSDYEHLLKANAT